MAYLAAACEETPIRVFSVRSLCSGREIACTVELRRIGLSWTCSNNTPWWRLVDAVRWRIASHRDRGEGCECEERGKDDPDIGWREDWVSPISHIRLSPTILPITGDPLNGMRRAEGKGHEPISRLLQQGTQKKTGTRTVSLSTSREIVVPCEPGVWVNEREHSNLGRTLPGTQNGSFV